MYYSYIILSKENNIYYKGMTTDILKRLLEHNNNLSRYTAGKEKSPVGLFSFPVCLILLTILTSGFYL